MLTLHLNNNLLIVINTNSQLIPQLINNLLITNMIFPDLTLIFLLNLKVNLLIVLAYLVCADFRCLEFLLDVVKVFLVVCPDFLDLMLVFELELF